MDYQIGDTVRIVSDPNIWFFGGGEYEIGDIATIEANERNNERIWYKLDVELYDDDQTVWRDNNLELVKVANAASKFKPGDVVILGTEEGQPTATIGYVQTEIFPDEGEQYIYYMLNNGEPDLSKG